MYNYNLRNNSDLQYDQNSSIQVRLYFKYRDGKTLNSISTNI